jgi:hydroxymethylbilane synthase
MMTKTIRFGSRGSELARWQTNHVLELLQAAWTDLQPEIQTFTTKGDRVLDAPLPAVGGKGLFTAELEEALHQGTIDLAVHSLKDLPTEVPAGLKIGAIPARANPHDALISRSGYTLDTLPEGATIGTSSLRRAAQLLHVRPDLKMIDIRGNVDTRIRKALDENGPYDAILLACAGLERLGLAEAVTQVLPFERMLPAPGQGALGIQCRDEAQTVELLSPIHHRETALAVTAERAFLAGLGGGCSVPVAAYATVEGSTLTLHGRVCGVDGRTQVEVVTIRTVSSMDDAYQVGFTLAQEAIEQGAAALLGAK